jgi:hypothetical protein
MSLSSDNVEVNELSPFIIKDMENENITQENDRFLLINEVDRTFEVKNMLLVQL